MMATDDLLCDSYAETWRDLRPRDRQRTASRILQSVESGAFHYAGTLVQNATNLSVESGEPTVTNITDNIG